MLWIIVPLVIIFPQALNGSGGGDYRIMVVAQRSAAKFAIYLLNMLHCARKVFVQQRYVFDIPIDVS